MGVRHSGVFVKRGSTVLLSPPTFSFKFKDLVAKQHAMHVCAIWCVERACFSHTMGGTLAIYIHGELRQYYD